MFNALRKIVGEWLLAGRERQAVTAGGDVPQATMTVEPVESGAAAPAGLPPAAQRQAGTLHAYDEHLLEHSRIQWHFGDWTSLAKLQLDTLQHHPDRAKLALLAAAAHMQLRQVDSGARFLRLAQDYGCSKKLIAQIMISGVHNSLGRAAIADRQQPRALAHFERSIALGAPGMDTRLLTQARAQEQFTQLQAPAAAAPSSGPGHPGPASADIAPRPCPLLPRQLVDDYFLPERREAALAALGAVCGSLVAGAPLPAISSTSVVHRDREYYFAHFEQDYIPSKIRDTGKFYEAPFLNLLARLHQPGKIIVDGGANLGNHSVFFAGVMKAQVIAFEPQPHNYLLLCANRSLNHLDQAIDVRARALGAQAGSISLHLAQENNFGTYTSADQADARTTSRFEVEMRTLDDELAEHVDHLSILKLDIEGMELSALEGARRCLQRGKPLVAVECFSKTLYLKIKDFLAQYDYFVIDSTNATPTFIFLNKSNPFHIKVLAAHLERASIDKLNANSDFNQH